MNNTTDGLSHDRPKHTVTIDSGDSAGSRVSCSARWILSLLIAFTAWIVIAPDAVAEVWRFAHITDSQRGSDDMPGNLGVSDRVLGAIANRLVSEGVDLVIVSGDLVEGVPFAFSRDPVREQYDYWKAVMAPVYDAGIAVYPVRGNHEAYAGPYDAESAFKVEFGYLPQNGPGGREGLTYSFTHQNAFFVGIDMYDGFAGIIKTVSQGWLDGQLANNTQPHVFIFAHEPMFGRNHDDAFTGGDRDDFLYSVRDANGRFYLCGHDHQHSRAAIADYNGDFMLQQVVAGPAGEKYYSYSPGSDPRDIEIEHQGSRCGYYLYEVDGLHVRASFVSSPAPGPENPPVFDWSVTDVFTCSADAPQYVVQDGTSYAGIDATTPPDAGYAGTTGTALAGTNTTGGNEVVSFGWYAPLDRPTEPDANLVTDVLWLRGHENELNLPYTDEFVFELHYEASAVPPAEEGRLLMAEYLGANTWHPAVNGNGGGEASFVVGPWQPGDPLGTYGVDPERNVAWAVLNHAGEFGVLLPPPPLPGDYDNDGDVDLDDFARWLDCLTGPEAGPYPPECSPGALDSDDDIDMHDASLFWDAMTNP
jgi:hypothetical protein